MNAPYAIVLASLLVQIGSKGPVAAAMRATTGRYDNTDPREQQARLEGAGKRALAAHNNGYEAIPPFAAGVVAAMHANVPVAGVTGLAAAFLVARIVYIPLYIKGISTVRSLVWAVGFVSTLALWALAAVGCKCL